MILKGITLCSLFWMLFNVGVSQNIHRSFCLGIPAALFKVIAAGWALPLQILGLVATILLTLALSLVSYELIEYRLTAFLKRCFCSSAK